MGTIIMIGQLILALAILVSLHEWGHYIAARSFGIRVEKFYIFFDAWGVKLFSKKINDTEWGIGWLPLGGYVKISGMIDESLDKEQMKSEPQDHEFRAKPAWQRLIVMLGGVTVNFILGILVFSLSLWHYGEQWLTSAAVNEVGIHATSLGEEAGFQDGDKIISLNGASYEEFRAYSNPALFIGNDSNPAYLIDRDGDLVTVTVTQEMMVKYAESQGLGFFRSRGVNHVGRVTKEAKAAGFKVGDRIVSINDTAVVYFYELQQTLTNYRGQEVKVGFERDGEAMAISHTISEDARIGIEVDADIIYEGKYNTTKYGFIESFPAGTKKGLDALGLNIKAFGGMISGKINPVKTVAGPIGIARFFGTDWNWQRFWSITGLLSFILAFMNLLPIPGLDGGHVVFTLVEMVIGRPLPEKFMYVMQVIGMILLFGLMAFILGIDFLNIFK